MKIPAGTQTGTNFRLRGKGAPKLRGGATGDQHVKVKLITPKNLNEQQREALRAFAEAGGIKVEEQQEDGFFDKFKDALAGKAEVVFLVKYKVDLPKFSISSKNAKSLIIKTRRTIIRSPGFCSCHVCTNKKPALE